MPEDQKPRRPKDPERDRQITESFHRMMATLQEPARPPDGVLPVIVGWVQMDVRMLK